MSQQNIFSHLVKDDIDQLLSKFNASSVPKFSAKEAVLNLQRKSRSILNHNYDQYSVYEDDNHRYIKTYDWIVYIPSIIDSEMPLEFIISEGGSINTHPQQPSFLDIKTKLNTLNPFNHKSYIEWLKMNKHDLDYSIRYWAVTRNKSKISEIDANIENLKLQRHMLVAALGVNITEFHEDSWLSFSERQKKFVEFDGDFEMFNNVHYLFSNSIVD